MRCWNSCDLVAADSLMGCSYPTCKSCLHSLKCRFGKSRCLAECGRRVTKHSTTSYICDDFWPTIDRNLAMGGKRRRQSSSYSGYSTLRDESISQDQTVTYHTTTRRVSHNDNTGYEDDASRSLYDDPNHNDTAESRPWTEASRPTTARPRTGVSTLGIENQGGYDAADRAHV